MNKLVSFLIMILSFNLNAAELSVEVLALFKDAAMLDISGEQILLKSGQQSPEGVKLISANSKEALISHQGETITLNLSKRIGASFTTPENISVSILLNSTGQYRTKGTINGRSVSLLVDTGANVVAINEQSAKSLGIDFSESRKTQVETASGMVGSRLVNLETVNVGGITVRNVQAVVIDGVYPVDILLGMSFLRDVDINESSGVMQLKGKF